jgi:ribokinase
MKKIIVAGSMNMDMVVKTSHIPKPGETVLGGSFFMNPGGKGANQAIAVARLGGDAAFIGKIGDDIFGKQSAQLFDEEGVNTLGIVSDVALPSGIALITVDKNGENSIVVAPGANANLQPADVEKAFGYYPDAEILLIQLEIPMETVAYTAKRAKRQGMQIILNPAPANDLPAETFQLIDIMTPNENEAEMLSGVRITDIEHAREAALKIQAKGATHVIITMGKQGAAVLEDNDFFHVPAPHVETLDTTAAGDVFNGALAVALSEGKPLREATDFACRAAAIAVTRLGAQASIPYRNEVLLSIIK